MATLQLDRKQRDLLLRKNDILSAAERVFAVKGYYRATMTDIAQEAQYGVGTIYLYFKDKQSLYISLFEKKMQELIRTVREKVSTQEDALEKIRILVKTELEFFVVNENFFKIFFSAREGLQLKVEDMVSSPVINLMMQLLDYVTGLVKQVQAKGVIRKDYSPQKVAYVLQHIMRAVIIPRLILEKEPAVKDVAEQSNFVVDVFLNGVGSK